MIAIGSGVAFLLVGVGLVWWCFSGDRLPAPPPEVKVLPPEEPVEVTIRIPKKKPVPQVKTLISLTPDEQKVVGLLTEKGINFLKNTQNVDGSWPGEWQHEFAAMGGLTLLECGRPADDPWVVRAAKFVREHAGEMHKTYGVSLFILFLDKLNDPQDQNLIKHLAMRLVAGQNPQGGWSYTVPPLAEADAAALYQFLQVVGKMSLKDFFAANPNRLGQVPGHLRHIGLFHFQDNLPPDFFIAGPHDNSNTQFALLALWAARRNRLPLDQPLAMVVQRFRVTQQSGGWWVYNSTTLKNHPHSGNSMICAGLLALAVGYGLDLPYTKAAPHPMQDQAIKQALNLLSQEIGQPHKDPNSKPPLKGIYFIWSVERVGVLFGLNKIVDKDWYRWGLDILQAYQNANGSWTFPREIAQGFSDISDTCLALLFLQQANLAQDLTDKLQDLLRDPADFRKIETKEK